MIFNKVEKKIAFFLSLIFFILVYPQTGNKANLQTDKKETLTNPTKLMQEADRLIYKDPAKALQIANKVYLLTKNSNSTTFAENCAILTEIYFLKGEHRKAIRYGEEAKKVYRILNDSHNEIKMLNTIAEQYAILGLFDDGLKKNWEAIQVAKSSLQKRNNEDNEISLAQSYDARSYILSEQNVEFDSVVKYNRLAYNQILVSKSSKNNHDKIVIANNFANTLLQKERKITIHELDEAFSTLNFARKLNSTLLHSKFESYISYNFGKYYFIKKNYRNAEKEFSDALEGAKKLKDIYLQKDSHNSLAKIYSVLKEPNRELEHRKAYNELSEEITHVQKRDTNSQISVITKEQQKSFFETKRNLVFVISATALLLIISIAIGIRNHRKSKREYANFQKLIERLQKEESLISLPTVQNSSIEKTTFSVSSEKETEILKKLDRFEKSEGFKNKNLSLSSLAESLNTNTAYLSTVINSNKNKNFNSYINELRINYIIHQLKNDPQYLKYKISHLAEKCGFSSHNTFTIAFSNLAGVSPSNFVKFLSQEKDISNN